MARRAHGGAHDGATTSTVHTSPADPEAAHACRHPFTCFAASDTTAALARATATTAGTTNAAAASTAHVTATTARATTIDAYTAATTAAIPRGG